MNIKAIKHIYLAQHNALGSRKEAEDKELFDQQHRQVWIDCDTELKARKAELEAKETITLKESAELAELESMFPSPPLPDPDYDRACELLATSPQVITQPEIWELLRIFGRKLGY
ncbi:hypothetical protein ES708_15437 [subsurface metagenome]